MINFNKLGMVLVLTTTLAGCSFLKPAENTDVQNNKEEVSNKVSGKLADLLGLGDELVCEFKVNELTQKSYIKGKQFYTEMVVDGKDVKTIVKDDCMWTWMLVGGKTQGTTMCFDPEDLKQAQGTESAKTIFDNKNTNIPTDVDYSCEKTDVDDNLFTPPSEIEFTDLSEMMKSLPAVGTGQPNVINNGKAPSEEEIKKLMEQFGQ